MLIREIVAGDIPALFHVRTHTRENRYTLEGLRAVGITPDSVRAWLEGSTKGWLAELPSAEVVGFCMADRSSGELQVVAVLPGHEGRGIGGRLMTQAETWLAGAGCARAWLTTDLDPGLRAHGFYLARGWTDWKIDGGLRWMQLALPRAVS